MRKLLEQLVRLGALAMGLEILIASLLRTELDSP